MAEPEVEPALDLDAVTVRYVIAAEGINTFKEYAIRSLSGRVVKDELVALNKVTLKVFPGETVGVIGPNGAGKSTLFRVIARVRRPNEGRVIVRGRVAPLLELGLGFHGELTGRENIILHGALMGFSRREMEERVPQISAFAELEPFLDLPIRTYSTGMSARLAFSAATDVDPDIILIDEALSVGDERFNAKCRERMASFREKGKTFLLVSHSLSDVAASCRRTVWIQNGVVVMDGASPEVTETYRKWCRDNGVKRPGEDRDAATA